jgi:photosystem I P700 chlorophyll a apoprotein A2
MYMGSAISISNIIFKSHWAHLAIIFLWASGIAFHITWNGNFELWVEDPVNVIPIGHSVWEPNFSNLESLGSDTNVLEASGVYNWLVGVGFSKATSIYRLVVGLEFLSLACLAISYISSLSGEGLLRYSSNHSYRVSSTKNAKSIIIKKVSLSVLYAKESIFKNQSLQAAYHLFALLGCSTILWSGHIIHCSIPSSRGKLESLSTFPEYSLWSLNSPAYQLGWSQDSLNHVLGSHLGSGSSILTFISGL